MSFLDFLPVPGWNKEPAYFTALQDERFDEAIVLLRQAMAQDDSHAMGIYGSLLALGRGIEENREEATAWFRQSAVRGDPYGQLAFGFSLLNGLGIEPDYSAAAFWFYQSARAGHREACFALRDLIETEPYLLGQHFEESQYLALTSVLPRQETIQ